MRRFASIALALSVLAGAVQAQNNDIVDGVVIEVLKDRLLAETFAARCDEYALDEAAVETDMSNMLKILSENDYPLDRLERFASGDLKDQIVYWANDDLWFSETSLDDADSRRFCAAAEGAFGDSAWSLAGLLVRR